MKTTTRTLLEQLGHYDIADEIEKLEALETQKAILREQLLAVEVDIANLVMQKTTQPKVVESTKKNAIDFWQNVVKTETCWLWAGAAPKGRAYFYVNGKTTNAARMAYSLTYGIIPYSYKVYRQCNEALCVNPEHLILAKRVPFNKH